MKQSKLLNNEITGILENGGIGISPTDTVYGVLAQAKNQQAVEKVYKLRERNPLKPCIILISEPKSLLEFGVANQDIAKAKYYWPAPITLILNVTDQPDYLTRGKKSLAFRIPDNAGLRKLIRRTGPLIAPSANPEGEPTAVTINQAKKYFGNNVDFYVGNNQPIAAKASTILDLTADPIKQLR